MPGKGTYNQDLLLGVIEIFDWFIFPMCCVIVMEKPNNYEELAKYVIRNGPLSEEVAKTIFLNVNHVFKSLD